MSAKSKNTSEAEKTADKVFSELLIHFSESELEVIKRVTELSRTQLLHLGTEKEKQLLQLVQRLRMSTTFYKTVDKLPLLQNQDRTHLRLVDSNYEALTKMEFYLSCYTLSMLWNCETCINYHFVQLRKLGVNNSTMLLLTSFISAQVAIVQIPTH
ncbi:MAG: hypothetical protein MK193_12810 [Lentisphaeria bacterium]|nr:hypothetical protein [Lentisphaeria bacterium]